MLMELSHNLLPLTVTGTPTNFTSVRTGDHTVKLLWSAPASKTPSIAGYEVFYAESGSDTILSGGTTTTRTTNISVTLPKLNVEYWFFVVAFSDADNALPSKRSSISTIVLIETGLFTLKAFPIHLVLVTRRS